MKKLLLTTIFLLGVSCVFAQSDPWSQLDWEQFKDESDLEYFEEYALYDIDGDGIFEAFLSDGDGMTAFLTCGGGKIKYEENTLNTTRFTIPQNGGYVCHSGFFGPQGNNHLEIYYKIENSQVVLSYRDETESGEDGDTHFCSLYKLGEGVRDISYTLYKKLVPQFDDVLTLDHLNWVKIKKP